MVGLFFSQNPKDFYMVGDRVDYTCIPGYYLTGTADVTCHEDQSWSAGARVCKSTSSPQKTTKTHHLTVRLKLLTVKDPVKLFPNLWMICVGQI